jgi:hypothetical protein
MPRKSPVEPYSTNVLDYPDTMSSSERESLAAEATLAAENKIIKKQPKQQGKPD